MRPKKTAGSDIRLGVSVDQLAAQNIGYVTRFPSLELSCDGVRKSGSCDSGYSCAYQYNLAWRSPTIPVPPEPNPRLLFERLFGVGAPGERKEGLKRRQMLQRSILGCRDKGGREVPIDGLSEEVVEALGDAMLSRDPGAELRVDLDCADCGHAWEVFFDVADFFWRELAALAQRLTAEVADLAQAYGWSERDILAMGSARRKLYMESIKR